MSMRNWKSEIFAARNLRELCNLLNEAENIFQAEAAELGVHWTGLAGLTENDLCELPTFGGDEPADTQGIFSWDATHFLVPGDEHPHAWKLIPR